MRHILQYALIVAISAVPVLAQHGGGHAGGGGMRGGGGVRGAGGGGSRGGGGMQGGYGGMHRSYGGGHGGYGGFHGGYGNHFHHGFGHNYVVGFYPGLYGAFGYYDPFWSYPYSPYDYGDSGYTPEDYGYQGSASPPVIINQQFQPPSEPNAVLHEYTYAPPPVPAPSSAPPSKYDQQLYLVAFHDGVIRAVLAYWAQGNSLHYVTMDHEQKQAALAAVDRGLSERLNAERNVTFQLPR